jgi:hypothetical protein
VARPADPGSSRRGGGGDDQPVKLTGPDELSQVG